MIHVQSSKLLFTAGNGLPAGVGIKLFVTPGNIDGGSLSTQFAGCRNCFITHSKRRNYIL